MRSGRKGRAMLDRRETIRMGLANLIARAGLIVCPIFIKNETCVNARQIQPMILNSRSERGPLYLISSIIEISCSFLSMVKVFNT